MTAVHGGEPAIEGRVVHIDKARRRLQLEKAFWLRLEELCRRERTTVHRLCETIAAGGNEAPEAAIRLYLLEYFSAAATEDGHRRAGHGSLEG
jgi:predicted DNA-binding ribbon-helix-helix protein